MDNNQKPETIPGNHSELSKGKWQMPRLTELDVANTKGIMGFNSDVDGITTNEEIPLS